MDITIRNTNVRCTALINGSIFFFRPTIVPSCILETSQNVADMPLLCTMKLSGRSDDAQWLVFSPPLNGYCHEIFGPKHASILGSPPPRTVLLEAHAFRSVKARVTASETAREMCADENEDLVEKACHYLFDGRYPEGSTTNEKRVIRRKAATLTLSDGVEVFYKKIKKNSTGQKVNIYIARSVWHPCIDDR